MTRPAFLVLALALLASLAAAAPPTTDEGVMVVDPCEAGPDVRAVALDAHDLCEVTMTVTTGEDVVPEVTATLRVADDVVTGSVFATRWEVGGCVFQFSTEEDIAGATGEIAYPTKLVVGCGEAERRCTFTSDDPLLPVNEADCWWVYEGGSSEAEIPRPTIDGPTVTFSATIDGPLAPYADLFVPGATILQRAAYAAPDVPFFTGRPLAPAFVCGLLDHCTYAGGDLVLGGGHLTLSE